MGSSEGCFGVATKTNTFSEWEIRLVGAKALGRYGRSPRASVE